MENTANTQFHLENVMYHKQDKPNNKEGETFFIKALFTLYNKKENFLCNNSIKECITMHNPKELVWTEHRQAQHLEHLFLCFKILILQPQ